MARSHEVLLTLAVRGDGRPLRRRGLGGFPATQETSEGSGEMGHSPSYASGTEQQEVAIDLKHHEADGEGPTHPVFRKLMLRGRGQLAALYNRSWPAVEPATSASAGYQRARHRIIGSITRATSRSDPSSIP